MKLKCQIVFFTLLLGLTGCFEDDNAEQLTSEHEPSTLSSPDVDRRLETVIDNLEEEDESVEEENVPLEEGAPLDEYLEEQEALEEEPEEEEPEEFIEDEEYESLPEED